MQDYDFVWAFYEKYGCASAFFTTKENAVQWIVDNHKFGVLVKHKLDLEETELLEHYHFEDEEDLTHESLNS